MSIEPKATRLSRGLTRNVQQWRRVFVRFCVLHTDARIYLGALPLQACLVPSGIEHPLSVSAYFSLILSGGEQPPFRFLQSELEASNSSLRIPDTERLMPTLIRRTNKLSRANEMIRSVFLPLSFSRSKASHRNFMSRLRLREMWWL